jgi:hypothetical protein
MDIVSRCVLIEGLIVDGPFALIGSFEQHHEKHRGQHDHSSEFQELTAIHIRWAQPADVFDKRKHTTNESKRNISCLVFRSVTANYLNPL